MCCNSRAAPGPGNWNCGRGSRSSRRTIDRHCEPTGRREAPPDDKLREAIHPSATRKNGLLRRFAPRNDVRNETGGNMTTETKIDTGTDELLCVIRDRVAVITLNRPEVRNAMSDTLTPALRTMIKTCGENPEVGVLLITGAGTAFCAGGNVKGMGAHRDKKKLDMAYDEKVADLQEPQRLLTRPLVSVP